MAIANNSSGGIVKASGTTHTQSFTVGAGSERKLWLGIEVQGGGDVVTSVTYAGNTMTQAVKRAAVFGAGYYEYLYYQDAPTSGANNIVVNLSGASAVALLYADYTGNGIGTDSTVQSSAGSGTTFAQAFTTVADNCWTINLIRTSAGGSNPAAGTGSFERVSGVAIGDNGLGLFDSNAAVTPAGSYTMNYTSSNTDWTSIGASFAPPAVANSGFFRAALM